MSPSRTRTTSPGTSSRAGIYLPGAVSQHLGLQGQLLLEELDGVVRLVLLPEADHGVQEERGR